MVIQPCIVASVVFLEARKVQLLNTGRIVLLQVGHVWPNFEFDKSALGRLGKQSSCQIRQGCPVGDANSLSPWVLWRSTEAVKSEAAGLASQGTR